MPTLGFLVDAEWNRRLKEVVSPPICTAEDLFERDALSIAAQCGCALEEVQALKQRVAMHVLSSSHTHIHTLAHAHTHTDREKERDKEKTSSVPMRLSECLSLCAESVVPTAEEITEHLHRFAGRPSGCKALDELFTGKGFAPGQLISLLGESKSGKSTLCVHTCAHTALSGQRVLLVNSCNHISPIHIESVLLQHCNAQMLSRSAHAPRSEQEKRQRVDEALSRIKICDAFSIWEALDFFSSLRARQQRCEQRRKKRQRETTTEKHSDTDTDADYDLIVVDCLHHWIAPYLHDSSATERTPYGTSSTTSSSTSSLVVNVHPLISQLLLLLKSISSEHTRKPTILLTNVLNREHLSFHQQRSFGPQSRTLSMNNTMMSTQRLSVMTGTGGPSHFLDLFDVVLCLSLSTRVVSLTEESTAAAGNSVSDQQRPNMLETVIEIGVVVRPPYWKDKPKTATLTLMSRPI